MKIKNLLSGLLFLLAVKANAQTTTHFSKLEIKEGEIFMVSSENILVVDTLIMHDNSVIRFDPTKFAMLESTRVIIGNNCLISSKGENGNPGNWLSHGGDGQDGGHLRLILHFYSLGTLFVDVRGGNGGPGANGADGTHGSPDQIETISFIDANGKEVKMKQVVPGIPGTNGSDATSGGNGGDGGRISLMYSTKDFVPVFNQENRDKNNIILLYQAGRIGLPGRPGRGGLRSSNGVLIANKFRDRYHGIIQLDNLNEPYIE